MGQKIVKFSSHYINVRAFVMRRWTALNEVDRFVRRSRSDDRPAAAAAAPSLPQPLPLRPASRPLENTRMARARRRNRTLTLRTEAPRRRRHRLLHFPERYRIN